MDRHHPRTSCSALEKMVGREVSFEEQMTVIREFIAGLLQEQEEWGEAAKVQSRRPGMRRRVVPL
jgi:hypothetical protein